VKENDQNEQKISDLIRDIAANIAIPTLYHIGKATTKIEPMIKW
jgi:hypothetical protein